jgi:hypothetical protein
VENESDTYQSEDDSPWAYKFVSYPDLSCNNLKAIIYSTPVFMDKPGVYINDNAIITSFNDYTKVVFNNKARPVSSLLNANDIVAVFPDKLIVRKNNAFYLVDPSGNFILPFAMDIVDFHDASVGVVWFKAFQKIGYIDISKNSFVPVGADSVEYFTNSSPNHLTTVKSSTNTFLINRNQPGVIMDTQGKKLFNVITGEVYIAANPQIPVQQPVPVQPIYQPTYQPTYQPISPEEINAIREMERPLGLPYDPVILDAYNAAMGNPTSSNNNNGKNCAKWQKMYNDAKYQAKVYNIKSDVNLILHEDDSTFRSNVKMGTFNESQAIDIYYRALDAGCNITR